MNIRLRHITLLICIGLLSTTFSYSQKLRSHKVRTGDTALLLTELYEVTLDDLLALNKNLNNNLVEGNTVLIPETYRLTEPIKLPKQVFSRFKLHKVKASETVFGVSQKYGIDQSVLLAFNSELNNQGLQRGMKIKIPIYRTEMVYSYIGNGLKSYEVQPQEGKWRISQKFGISIAQLELINPDLPETLASGQIINVPNKSSVDPNTEDLDYYYYEVPPKIGYLKLEQTLGFTREEIMEWNPILREKGLMAGMVLKLPKQIIESPKPDSETTERIPQVKFADLSEKKLAVIMPFQLDNYSVNDPSALKNVFSNRSFLGLSLDFYSGMALALEDAKAAGLTVTVDVFDSANDKSTLNKVLNSRDFGYYDAIVGPIDPGLFDETAIKLSSDEVPCIAPFTLPKENRENIFQSIPSDLQLKNAIISQIQNDDTVDQIVIVSDRANRSRSNELKTQFPQARMVFSRVSKSGADSYFLTVEEMRNNLINGHNMVILETDNVGFASNVASILNGLLTSQREISLATTHFNPAFENEDFSNSYKNNLRFRYATINRPMDALRSEEFVDRFQERFHAYPNRYAVRAYDLTLDLLYRLGMHSNLYKSVGNLMVADLLENNFEYQKLPNGGYENVSCFVVAYDNYELKILSK